jgi:membrane protease YdiL (CAAX protease family)
LKTYHHRIEQIRLAVIVGLSIPVFALLVMMPGILKLLAVIIVVADAFLVSRWLNISADVEGLFRIRYNPRFMLYIILAIIIGLIAGIFERSTYMLSIFPTTIYPFVILSIFIGATEEFIFRGMIQTAIEKFDPVIAIVFGALVHAAYKALLFIQPGMQGNADPAELFMWSSQAFLVLGVIKTFSKSLWPPIIIHVIFDFMYYADQPKVPWWIF